jgi:hypothetical protein
VCNNFIQRDIFVPDRWGGRLWARTGCNFDGSGRGHCVISDCDNKLECNGAAPTPPVTLVEFMLNDLGLIDVYHVSLVDGFKVRIRVRRSYGIYE